MLLFLMPSMISGVLGRNRKSMMFMEHILLEGGVSERYCTRKSGMEGMYVQIRSTTSIRASMGRH